MPYPNLFIIGPPKCGTTSLFDWLSAHPDTLSSKVKETYYFYDEANIESTFPNYVSHGIEPFQALFDEWKGQKIIFEASPGHIYSSCIFDGIKEMGNIPKAIFVYRDPSERLYSEYKFQRYKTQLTRKTFSEFVEFDGSVFNNTSVLKLSEYTPFLRRWMEIGLDNLLIYRFTDIIETPDLVMKSIASRLQIDPEFYNNIQLEAKNVTYQVRHPELHRFALKAKQLIPRGLRKMLATAYLKINKSEVPDKTDEESQILDRLKTFYEPSVTTFHATFGSSIISINPNNLSQ